MNAIRFIPSLRRPSNRLFSSSLGDVRPFKILGVQQIALGALNKSMLGVLWSDIFGIPKVHTFKSEQENVDEDILQIGSGPCAVEIDLMQPIDPVKSPKVHIPALNHIGLWVDDLDKCFHYLEQRGVRFAPGGIRAGASGHNVCFIHPKGSDKSPISGSGVLIELIQAPKDVISHFEAANK